MRPVSRPLRALTAVLLAGAVTAGCTGAGGHTDAPGGRCTGVRTEDVRGPRPAYVEGELSRFANDDAVCRALWLPRADRWFVPQGLALDGRTAWVSGYRWREGYGNRPCRVMRVDLRSGRLLADQPRLEVRLPGGAEVFCRHGGGLALDAHGLWVAESRRLWLLDPSRTGGRDAVLRLWRLQEPVSGGLLVRAPRGMLGLGDFRLRGTGPVHWYRPADLLAPGATSVGPRRGGAGAVRPVRVTRAPRYAQGGAFNPGRRHRAPYLVSSLSSCGQLHTPDGRTVDLGPGAEGIAFDGRGGLWAVLESGARSYQAKGRPLVPMLVRFDVDRLEAGSDEGCGW